MKNLKKLSLTLALLITAVAGAWADDTNPAVTIDNTKTQPTASFTMPASDVTVNYMLVRDMQDQANPVTFDGLPTNGNIVVKKGDDGKYQPAEELTIQLIDPLAAEDDKNIIAADGITVTIEQKGNGDNWTSVNSTFAAFLADMQPGTYRLTATATDDGPYTGTVTSEAFTLVEQYDLTVKPADEYSKGKVESVTVGSESVNIDANTGEATKTGIAPDTEVKIKAKNGYIIEEVKVKKTAAPSAPDGAINGIFSVSATKKVYFSKGNLRYASGAWSFFGNQYDYYTSYSEDAWDKFGWSTSATTYGMNTSTIHSTYSGNFVDWGSNSDLQTALGTGWFTLSKDEWTYLFNTRSASTVNDTENGRYAKAKVNDVPGVILFPDTYIHPAGVAAPTGVNATNNTNTGWNGNSYTAADWTKMESAGCVFLPAAGYRNGSSVDALGSNGFYWSASPKTANRAYIVYFYSSYLDPANDGGRSTGYSVRLVRQVTE